MSSMPEPLRPAYVAGESVGAGANTGNAESVSSSAKKTPTRSRAQRYAAKSQKKQGKSARKSAKSLVKAAYEPLRRAVSGSAKPRDAAERRASAGENAQPAAQQSEAVAYATTVSSRALSPEDRRTHRTAQPAIVEVLEAPATVIDTPAEEARRLAAAEDIAAMVSAVANASSGLAVVAPPEADRLKAAEAMMRESLQKYQAAMRQMEVRFEVLDRDISLKKNRNPIHHIESRIKKPASIFEKLQRQGFPVTIESMEQNLFDIAGVRVICSYIFDVYNLLDLMKKQDDLEIVTIKDYIASPKPNGYRSLHAIVRIPVYFMDKKEMVPVEVQLRTIAMDFWASLEHSLKYKAVREVEGIDTSDELKDCSRIIEDVEARMQILAKALEMEE